MCSRHPQYTNILANKKRYVSRPVPPLHEQRLHTSAFALKQLSQVAVVGLDIAHKPVWNTAVAVAVAVARKASIGTKHSHKKHSSKDTSRCHSDATLQG